MLTGHCYPQLNIDFDTGTIDSANEQTTTSPAQGVQIDLAKIVRFTAFHRLQRLEPALDLHGPHVPCLRNAGGHRAYQITVVKKAEPAMSATPARNIAVSNRVISQLLRILRLNCWTVSDKYWLEKLRSC
jgi:hypothetical protein